MDHSKTPSAITAIFKMPVSAILLADLYALKAAGHKIGVSLDCFTFRGTIEEYAMMNRIFAGGEILV